MPRKTTLAEQEGSYADDRPPEKQPGTSAHLGENPYQGGPYPEPAAPAASSSSSSKKTSSSGSDA